MSATISTNAQNAGEAVSANNERYNRAEQAVLKTGVGRSDMTLSNYNVNYVPKPQGSIERPVQDQQWGYTVTRSFDIKVREMGKAGAVVDAVTSVDGATIDGVSFGVADSSTAQKQATARAVEDARIQAQALASAAGLRIVGIKRIEQGSGNTVAPMMMKAMAASQPSPTAFDAGSVSVRADVTIIYLAAP